MEASTTTPLTISLQDIDNIVQTMEANYAVFVSSLLVCYTDGDVGEVDFDTLRDDVSMDAITYLKGVAPICKDALK
jgi:hypothetical protein